MHLIYPAAIGLIAFATACSGPAEQVADEPVAEITATPVIVTDLKEVIEGFGVVEFEPSGQNTIAAEIESHVVEILASPGDAVSAGAPVMRISPSSGAGLEIATAVRDASNAEAAAARSRRLRADGLASNADVEAAETNARDLSARAANLQSRADAISTVSAPAAGVIDQIFIAQGDLVPAGSPLARIASPDSIRARIGVEIEDALRLKAGDAASLNALDKGGAADEGLIRNVDRRVDPATRMATVLVDLHAGHGFAAGEAIRAELAVDIKTNAIAAPRKAIFYDENGAHVFVAVNGAAEKRAIDLGIISGDLVEVTRGLAPTDRVIVEGGAVLSDGMKIRETAMTDSVGAADKSQ